jgi:hypothetical protein
VRDANHGLRKDMEDKVLLFPYFDPVELAALAHEDDKAANRVKVDPSDASVEKLYDTLEDCVLEIEELKDELATIVHTQTGQSMRDRWDTPETREAGGKKGRLRKDRYSSLLMANMVGRLLQRAEPESAYQAVGRVRPETWPAAGPRRRPPPVRGRPGTSRRRPPPAEGAVVRRRCMSRCMEPVGLQSHPNPRVAPRGG